MKPKLLALMSLLVAGCTSDKPIEVFRDVSGLKRFGISMHVYVLPNSVREVEHERLINVKGEVTSTGILPLEKLAEISPQKISETVSFNCDKRTFQIINQTFISFDGKATVAPPSERQNVLPESPKEAVMDFACASNISRVRKTLDNEPIVRSE